MISQHDYVPWVLVDGVLLENTNSLLSAICKAYTGPPPASCVHYFDVEPVEASRCMNYNLTAI